MKRKEKDIENILKMIKTSSHVNPDPVFKRNARIRLLNQIEYLSENTKQKTTINYYFIKLKRHAFAFALVLIILFIPSTVLAAQNSLPNDILYKVKTTSEDLALLIPFSNDLKANLHTEIIQRRKAEFLQLSDEGKKEDAEKAFQNYKEAIENAKKIKALTPLHLKQIQKDYEKDLNKNVTPKVIPTIIVPSNVKPDINEEKQEKSVNTNQNQKNSPNEPENDKKDDNQSSSKNPKK